MKERTGAALAQRTGAALVHAGGASTRHPPATWSGRAPRVSRTALRPSAAARPDPTHGTASSCHRQRRTVPCRRPPQRTAAAGVRRGLGRDEVADHVERGHAGGGRLPALQRGCQALGGQPEVPGMGGDTGEGSRGLKRHGSE